MKNKLTLSSTCLLLLLTSCSKTENITIVESKADTERLTFDEKLSVSTWSKLIINQNRPNIALAELIASEVTLSDKEGVKKFISENLTVEDAESIFESLSTNNLAKRQMFLYGQTPWSKNKELLDKSINHSDEIKTIEFDNFENQIKTAVVTKIQSQLLKNILDTYEIEANKAAEMLAPSVALNFSEEDKALIENDLKNGKKDSAMIKIKNAILKINEFNDIKNRADLTLSQTGELAAVAFLTNQIYLKIKDTQSFNDLLKLYEKAKDLNETRKKLIAYSQGIATSFDNLKSNYSDLRHTSTALRKDTTDLLNSLKKDSIQFSKNTRSEREQIKFLYDRFYKNKNQNPKDTAKADAVYLQKLDNIAQNIDKAANSVGKISGNLNSILDNVNQISHALGIKLGKDAIKAMASAQKASKVISTVSNTMKAFATGGMLSAGNALLTSGLGLGGADQTMEMLGALDKKLDQVIDLQKQTIQLQLDTMKMIRYMAVMIDEYHQKEMMALAEIRSTQMIQSEMQKTLLNTEIRKCERMISFQLSQNSKINTQYSPFADPSFLNLTFKEFYGANKNYHNLKSIIRSTEFNGFNDCVSGINEAFGTFNIYENPILGIYSSIDGSDFYKFQNTSYLPLLNFLQDSVQNKIGANRDFNNSELSLHAPIKNLKDIHLKDIQISNPAFFQSSEEVYLLDKLISPKALLRYANSLLVLYPLIEVEKTFWEQGPVQVVNSYIEDVLNLDHNMNQSQQRSLYLLKNALYLTQSAIAQESIISGEPILKLIYEDKNSILNNDKLNYLSSAIYSNKLLLKNYLNYSFYKDLKLNLESYRKLNESKDLIGMNQFINKISGLDGTIINENNLLYFSNNQTKFLLPSEKDLIDGDIYYTENMVKLIKLEFKIIDAILQMAPEFKNSTEANKFAAILLQKI